MSLIPPPDTGQPPAPARRTGRGPDYRLRGLDLGAPSVAAAPVPRTRKRNPVVRRRRLRLVVQWCVAAVVMVVAALLLRASVVEPFSVPSTSMVPTLQVGDHILVVKSTLLSGPIRIGDILVFHEPQVISCGPAAQQSQDIVQRVVGLPGETIWSNSDTIFLDGRRLHEAGWYNPPFGQLGATPIARTKIPADSYYMLGDNRTDTCDSRSFGAVPQSLVVGKVVSTLARAGHIHVHLF